jgi:alpha-glucosidase (family GH31 glycosyl hydrolase)
MPLVRPLFMEFPEAEEDFYTSDRFMFGSNILVTPKFSGNDAHHRVPKEMRDPRSPDSYDLFDFVMPEGDWINYQTKRYEESPYIYRTLHEYEIGMFVKCGVILPVLDHRGRQTL